MDGSRSVRIPETENGHTVDTKAPDFSVEDLIAEISAQLDEQGGGLTTKELTIALGLIPTTQNRGRVWNRLSDQIVLGHAWVAGSKQGTKLDGTLKRVNCYRVSREAVEDLVRFFRGGR